MSRLRVPAWTLPPAVAAQPWRDSPQRAVQAHFEALYASAMQGLPFLNTALSVRALGFQRIDGDWLGALIAPWCVQLMLLPGGGRLWQHMPTGERAAVALPVGMLDFIAEAGEGIVPAFQYFPLLNGVGQLPGMDAAQAVVCDALGTALTPPQAADAPACAPPPASPDAGRRRLIGLGSSR